MTASDPKILRLKLKDSDIRLPQRQDKEDFLYGIKHKATTMADAEVGHRTCSMCQIAHIAIQRGRRLEWDPGRERFGNDEAANEMLRRPYRAPWDLNITL